MSWFGWIVLLTCANAVVPASGVRELRQLSLELELAQQEPLPYVVVRPEAMEIFVAGLVVEHFPLQGFRQSGGLPSLASVRSIEPLRLSLRPKAPFGEPPRRIVANWDTGELAPQAFVIRMDDGSKIILISNDLRILLGNLAGRPLRLPLPGASEEGSDLRLSSLHLSLDAENLAHFLGHLRPEMKVVFGGESQNLLP